MKRIAPALILLLALSGCSALNVSWSLNASYNTNAQTITQTLHTKPAADEKK